MSVHSTNTQCGTVALWLEHWTCNQQVIGLSPGHSASPLSSCSHTHVPLSKQYNLVPAKGRRTGSIYPPGSVSIVRRFDSPKVQLKLKLALTLTDTEGAVLTVTDTGDLRTIEPSDYRADTTHLLRAQWPRKWTWAPRLCSTGVLWWFYPFLYIQYISNWTYNSNVGRWTSGYMKWYFSVIAYHAAEDSCKFVEQLSILWLNCRKILQQDFKLGCSLNAPDTQSPDINTSCRSSRWSVQQHSCIINTRLIYHHHTAFYIHQKEIQPVSYPGSRKETI